VAGEQRDDFAIPTTASPHAETDACGCGPSCTDACCTDKGGNHK
jgi:hypothetical protein